MQADSSACQMIVRVMFTLNEILCEAGWDMFELTVRLYAVVRFERNVMCEVKSVLKISFLMI